MKIAKYILIDVMLRGRFVHTFRISTLLAERFEDNKPVFSVNRIAEHIESRMPSLKGQPYNICF
ncbi:MAG: hypothetical protein PUE39_03405 [bacterium]|nr:hypothetical protein [bacterium]